MTLYQLLEHVELDANVELYVPGQKMWRTDGKERVMELISRDEVMRLAENGKLLSGSFGERAKDIIKAIPTIEERKVGKWKRTGRTNVYGGEELVCPFCGDRVMVQNIKYELYCRQCGALLGDRYEVEEGE